MESRRKLLSWLYIAGKLAGNFELHASVARRRSQTPTGNRRLAVMGVPSDDAVLIQKPKRPGEPFVITVNCPDKTGLGCDICRTVLDFGLCVTKGGRGNLRYTVLTLCGVVTFGSENYFLNCLVYVCWDSFCCDSYCVRGRRSSSAVVCTFYAERNLTESFPVI